MAHKKASKTGVATNTGETLCAWHMARCIGKNISVYGRLKKQCGVVSGK